MATRTRQALLLIACLLLVPPPGWCCIAAACPTASTVPVAPAEQKAGCPHCCADPTSPETAHQIPDPVPAAPGVICCCHPGMPFPERTVEVAPDHAAAVLNPPLAAPSVTGADLDPFLLPGKARERALHLLHCVWLC